MPFPKVNACLVVEFVRQEAYRKLSIFGLYGMTPNVQILLQEFPASIGPITFFLFCDPGEGDYTGSFRINDEEDNPVIELEEMDLGITQRLLKGGKGGHRFLIPIPLIRFENAGTYKVELNVDGKPHYETTFEVGVAPPGLLTG